MDKDNTDSLPLPSSPRPSSPVQSYDGSPEVEPDWIERRWGKKDNAPAKESRPSEDKVGLSIFLPSVELPSSASINHRQGLVVSRSSPRPVTTEPPRKRYPEPSLSIRSPLRNIHSQLPASKPSGGFLSVKTGWVAREEQHLQLLGRLPTKELVPSSRISKRFKSKDLKLQKQKQDEQQRLEQEQALAQERRRKQHGLIHKHRRPH